MLSGDYEITHYNINKKPLTPEQYAEICHMDKLIFAFPLYIDAVPSHLFRMLVNLEGYLKKEMKGEIFVYALVNNGFYEGEQNHIAFEIIDNWCKRCGLHFGEGIGHGAGEMLGIVQNIPVGKGPLTNLGLAMKSLVNSINTQSGGETALKNPNFPHFLWRLSAHAYWRSQAKKNGLKIKDITRKIGSNSKSDL
jgi:hypothetical protein